MLVMVLDELHYDVNKNLGSWLLHGGMYSSVCMLLVSVGKGAIPLVKTRLRKYNMGACIRILTRICLFHRVEA